jgi:hypothetical protein
MANTDLEQLVVKMSADLSKFEKQMLKAQGISNQAAGRIQKQFKDMNKGIAADVGALGNVFKGAFAALSVTKVVTTMRDVVKGVADIGDSADKLHLSTDEFQRLQFTAQLAGVEAETFAKGMAKLALNTSEASRGQGDLGKLFAANGISILDQNGKLLSQKEILAKVADLVKHTANEQDQNAVATAALGKAGAESLGLLAQGGDAVREAFSKANQTPIFSQEEIRKAQELDDQFDILVRKVEILGKQFVLTETQDVYGFFNALSQQAVVAGTYIDGLAAKVSSMVSYLNTHDTSGNLLPDAADKLRIVQQISDISRTIPVTPGNTDGKSDLGGAANPDGSKRTLDKPTNIPANITKPKITKVKAAPKAKGPNDYQQSVAQLQESIALIQAETAAANANVQSLTGYDAALKKAQISAGLLNDAKKAGIAITPQLRQNIDELSSSYVTMQEKLDAAKQAHEDFIANIEEMKSLSKDVLGGFISDIKNGTDAVDALHSAFEKISDKLIEIAVNNLVENALGGGLGGGGGGFGGILSSIFGFANGGIMSSGGKMTANAYAGGGIAKGPQLALFGEGRMNEAYVPLPDGKSIPVSMKGGGSGSSSVNISISLAGANGNAEVESIARRAAAQGIREAQKLQPKADIERRLRVA